MRITWPTVLTLLRIVLIPVMVALFYVGTDTARWAALAVFIVAALTDWFDGWLARRTNTGSRLGEMLDPIADKLIVAAALVMMVKDATIHDYTVIAAIVIVSREILLSGLREYLAAAQVKVRVSRIAKLKTAIQMVAICVLIAAPPLVPFWPDIDLAGAVGLWVAAALTVYTGWGYLVASLRYMED
ncbi:MAG: CDP-diacylglycerol--glycerol-3-phosphate 3-phosphatidyltransferase [Micropepsaceae bacterium]